MSSKTKKNSESSLSEALQLVETYCTEEWKDVLEMNKTISSFPAKVKIFNEGDEANVVQIIKSGKVKVVTDVDGKEQIIRLAGDNQILGHRGFGGDNHYTVSAIALTEVDVISIPRKIFDNVLKANAHFCYYMMLFFAEELKRSENQFKKMAHMQVKNRVAKALKMNIDAFGIEATASKKLNYTLSRKDISNVALTTYESVIRVLSELEGEHIIKLEGKEIIILDIKALHNLSSF